MPHFFLVCLAGLLAGCAGPSKRDGRAWADLGMNGMILDLEDPKIMEHYAFGPKRIVAAGVGEKNGLIAAPVFFWRVRGDLLLIDDDAGKPVDRLRLIEVRKSEVVVKRNDGTEAVFAMKRRAAR